MSTQSSHGSFDCVDLEGKCVGAAMTIRHGFSGELRERCNMNIYINNNTQGVNNSALVGDGIRMRDPGICLSLSNVKLGKTFLKIDKKWRRDSILKFSGMFLFLAVTIFLFSSLIYH
ncbi:hypothetical protein NMG60_11034621 [Bertholletia excelsa]